MDAIQIHTNQSASISLPTTEPGVIQATEPTQAFLRARPRDDALVVLDVEANVGARTAQVTLLPDALSPGIYRIWMHLIFPDASTRDTAERELVMLEHAPGTGVRTGRAYRLARQKVPVAWDALSNYRDFGDVGLMDIIHLVELRVFGRVLTITEEASLDQRVTNYLAHLAAIESVEPAISFWQSQIISQTAVGSSEVTTFPDRIRAAEAQLQRMRDQAPALRAEVELLLGVLAGPSSEPTLENGGTLTPNLDAYHGLYGCRHQLGTGDLYVDEGVYGGSFS
jgi:hypothetical protein